MLDLPLEYALVKFKGNKFSGKIVPELLDLAEKGIVRFVDIVFLQKEKDGNIRTVELNDLEPAAYKMFVPMGKHVSSLFTDDDLEIAAAQLPKKFGSSPLPVGEPVGCQSPRGHCERRRPARRSHPNCTRSGPAVQEEACREKGQETGGEESPCEKEKPSG